MSLPVFIADLDAFLAGGRPELPESGSTFLLKGAEAKHAGTVKRLQPGQEAVLIDGHGSGVQATVEEVRPAELVFRAGAQVQAEGSGVTIVQAIPKSERSELAVDLMTQGGVDEIIPWQASRCIAKWGNKAEKAAVKWRSAAVSAAKQSRRLSVPRIQGLHSTQDVIAKVREALTSGGTAVMLHEEGAVPFHELEFGGPVVFIIGPEGGLSPEEVAAFSEAGARTAVLGPEVLRTASAGLVAMAAYGALVRWR